MVIDSSAVAAILFDEPDFRRYSDAIEAAPIRFMSVVTRVELSFVIESRKGLAGRQRLDRFFQMSGTEIVSATPQQAAIAIEAFRHFGKGHHKAALNIGDCFSYALASTTGHPLLFASSASLPSTPPSTPSAIYSPTNPSSYPYRKRTSRFKHALACHCGVGSPYEGPLSG